MFATPIYHIDLRYGVLRSGGSQEALQALFGNMLGQFGTFRVRKSDYTRNDLDSRETGQQLGIGDGANPVFLFTRTIQTDFVSSYTEPVGVVEATGLNVYVNGALVSSNDYTVIWPNAVQFDTPPAVGAQITADYEWYFLCAFEEDNLEMSAIGQYIWAADSVKLVTVKT